jgi:hypothetical protein
MSVIVPAKSEESETENSSMLASFIGRLLKLLMIFPERLPFPQEDTE